MKRQVSSTSDTTSHTKKPKPDTQPDTSTAQVLSDDNLLYEILKHADARALAAAACVSPQWRVTARDERLWELICTRHWASIGCAEKQLRSVVLALGGFRKLHSLYLWPLSKPGSKNGKSSAWRGKEEVLLSLSLLSIRYYEKIGFSNRGKGV